MIYLVVSGLRDLHGYKHLKTSDLIVCKSQIVSVWLSELPPLANHHLSHPSVGSLRSQQVSSDTQRDSHSSEESLGDKNQVNTIIIHMHIPNYLWKRRCYLSWHEGL